MDHSLRRPSRIATVVAIVVAAIVASGCTSVTPTVPISTTPAPIASSPLVLATAQPTIVAATPPPAFPVDLEIAPAPAFVGDHLTLTVTSFLNSVTPSPPLSSATVDFGDGTSATGTGSCTTEVRLSDTYRTAGDFQATLTAASACDPSASVDLSNVVAMIHVFPAAPAASASWPVCTTFQLRLAGPYTGFGLGNVVTLITVRNISASSCTLTGYPGLVLIGAEGSFLPTHVRPAITGAYMFPAIVPHRVALAPGGVASFMIGYGDNPFGPDANKPYNIACPPSVAVRVILPGTDEFGTARVSMRVCEGSVSVSPIVPGADGLRF